LNKHGRYVEHARNDGAGALKGIQPPRLSLNGNAHAGDRSMLTAVTHMLLRRTVKRWFAAEPSVPVIRRKLNRFVGSIDPMPRAYCANPAGEAGGAQLTMIQPRRKPPAAQAPLLLYFHGGGYIVGGLSSHGAFCARLARAIGGRVLFADYRLAPEHPFPAALEDGLAALRRARELAPGRLLIGGDSAGGGLALAVVQAALAQSAAVPERLILLSPWTDLTLSGASMVRNAATDSLLSTKILTRMRASYLGGHEPADRRASPLFDPNTHLPPVLLIYSGSEVLRDDSTRLAENLRLGGTQVQAHAYAGTPHVFPLFRTVPAAGKALKNIAQFTGGA
jgi:monoterpene epsilon-lactone hydrolase